MTGREFSEADTRKALEHCCVQRDCKDCPYNRNVFEGCMIYLLSDAYDIINRLTTENEIFEKKIQNLFEEGLGDKAYLCEIIRVDTMTQTLKWLREQGYLTISNEEGYDIITKMIGVDDDNE